VNAAASASKPKLLTGCARSRAALLVRLKSMLIDAEKRFYQVRYAQEQARKIANISKPRRLRMVRARGTSANKRAAGRMPRAAGQHPEGESSLGTQRAERNESVFSGRSS
jgi:hypothetical protein